MASHWPILSFAIVALVTAGGAIVTRHRHARAIATGAVAALAFATAAAIALAWLLPDLRSGTGLAFLTLVANTASVFVFGVAAMVGAKLASRRERG